MNKTALLLLSTSLTATSAIAGTMGALLDSQWGWVGTLSAGPTWDNGGTTQTFFLTPTIEKTYTANKASKALFDGEVFVGMQKFLKPNLQGQIGLAVAATSSAKLDGHIWDDADPLFDNYSYQYKIQHTHIAAKGKLLLERGYWATPWVSASLGVAFNNAHSFTNTPLIFEAIANSNFSSNTETAFTYTVGAGLQKPVAEHWQVGVGYEFADWGKSNLGQALGQTLNTGIKLNHLYTNGLLFNLTYAA